MKGELDVQELETELSSASDDEVVREDSEIFANKPPSRLGQCEVCAGQAARYSCPKCEVKTCSVRCVQIHKKELNCNGIRDRTKYIPLRKMTKNDFMSDYYFLEEATRYVAARKTDTVKSYTRYNKLLPPRLFGLRKAAAERKTTLRFLLNNFSRNKENTSIYDWSQKRIFWRVEWIFTNACNAKYEDERCDEEQPLYKLLEKYVSVQGMKGLEYYQSVGVFGLKVLLKAEGIKRCKSRFYQLNCAQSLRANLAGKTLVEFPCIYVSYEENPGGLDVIDSDEDVDNETKQHELKIDALNKEQRQKQWQTQNANTTDDIDDDEDSIKLQQLLRQKKIEERQKKREEFEKTPNNYLFADELLWDILSSSSDGENGNETAEETEPI